MRGFSSFDETQDPDPDLPIGEVIAEFEDR